MALLLIVHFAFTVAYLMPPNPLRLEHQAAISGYMEPYFAQNWSLFAPDPIVDTRLLLVACRRRGHGPDAHVSWTNITAPLRRTRATQRIGPVLAIERNQMGALHSVFAPEDPLIARLAAVDAEKYASVIATYDAVRSRIAERGLRVLRRVASAECDRLHGAGGTSEVGMRMVIIKSPPFSRRGQPLERGETHYVDLPWGSHERVAAY